MNVFVPTSWDRETLIIDVDAREADDLFALLQALSVACGQPSDSETAGRKLIAALGNPDEQEQNRIGHLVEEFNKMRKSRSSFG